ncbi:hypothetical protein [Oceanobacillus rekensis]|uniref:hypothetical protein n=1 Tax=Oceanobacillus rekensis TaxID=937927 RepID=UPI000B451220|nr:hypothetical protein [Oceanobacillus rekensis]
MWVRSQDGKELVESKSFSITKNFGGKKKSAIIATVPNGFWGSKTILLGLYDTKNIAMDELKRLQDALVNSIELFEIH